MKNKYKLQNQDKSVKAHGEVGDIKKIQRKLENRASRSELIGKWIIYILIILMLIWVVFNAPILK